MSNVNKTKLVTFIEYDMAHQYFFEGKPDECWLWFGNFDSRGNPRIKIKQVIYKAHRIILLYSLKIQQSDLWVLHKPDCKLQNKCVNPSHMFLGTPKQSTGLLIDSYRHDSLNRKGENHPMTILTDNKVLNIRDDYKNGLSYIEISNKYKVSYTLIIQIINRELWRHI